MAGPSGRSANYVRRFLDTARALDVAFIQIAEGLEYAHGEKLLPRSQTIQYLLS